MNEIRERATGIVARYEERCGADAPIELASLRGDDWRAAVITPSAKQPGGWQLSFFTREGFYGDCQHASKQEAVEEALLDGFGTPRPGLLASVQHLPSFRKCTEPHRAGTEPQMAAVCSSLG